MEYLSTLHISLTMALIHIYGHDIMHTDLLKLACLPVTTVPSSTVVDWVSWVQWGLIPQFDNLLLNPNGIKLLWV